jgi:hypothetical protein
MRQLLIYLRKNVSQSDKRVLGFLDRAEDELQRVQRDCIGGKVNYASVRVADELVSVAAHLLAQHPTRQTKNELKQQLLRIRSMMGVMACNSSAIPYRENIAKIWQSHQEYWKSISPFNEFHKNNGESLEFLELSPHRRLKIKPDT